MLTEWKENLNFADLSEDSASDESRCGSFVGKVKFVQQLEVPLSPIHTKTKLGQ
jgi:hypothetical protein